MSSPSSRDALEQHLTPVPLARPESQSRAKLPLSLTSFVGRKCELDVAVAAVRKEGLRLLTLTGPGGVGKTRLAVRIAEELTGDFPDGVWFVSLAPIHDAALVIDTIASSVGMRELAGRPIIEGLQAFFRNQHALLILDNFEHVLDAAPVVTELLAPCPQLTILVTSRAVLRVSGERDLVVHPFALPDLDRLPSLPDLEEESAVRLFTERARNGFALTAENATTVAQICKRLDGLPLAIELAAARTNHLSPEGLLNRLEQRLVLLTGGPRDAPVRLRTMRDAIAWSHELLTPEERNLFRRLAVFVGGFTLEAAEHVCSENINEGGHAASILDGVASLVEKSLLRPTPDATRFGMLETIREFGLEQLEESGEECAIRERHAGYIQDLVERSSPVLLGGQGQLHWLKVFDEELPNVRAALTWLNDTSDEVRAAELTFALWRFWQIRDHYLEGTTWCDRALDNGERLPADLRANVLAERGFFEFFRLAPERALATLDEAVQCALFAQDAKAIAWSQVLRAVGRLRIGDFDGAIADAKKSVAIYTELGQDWFAAEALWYVGLIRYFSGDVDGAEMIFPQYIANMEAMGDHFEIGGFSANLGGMALDYHNEELALSHFRRSLSCGRLLDSDYLIADAVEGIAVALSRNGEMKRAARLLGAMDVLRARSVSVRVKARDAYVKPAVALLRDALGPEAMETAWNDGRTMPIEDVLADAEAAGGSSTSVRSDQTQFTSRELEVLRRLVEGKSDLQISNALSISRRTAATHVANIYRKLDVNSRAAAAAYAVRHGLA